MEWIKDILDGGSLATIITLIIGALSAFFVKIKPYIKKVVNLLKEVYQMAETMEKALDDDAISKAEIKAIKKEFGELKEAFKAFKK